MVEEIKLDAVIDHWSDEQLECRALRHDLKPFTARQYGGGYETVYRCARCGVKVITRLDARGRILRSKHTDYQDGYLVRGLGRLGRDQRGAIRLAAIERLFA